MISIQGSTRPFLAFLGSILSVMQGVAVEPTPFNPDIYLDTIEEGEEDEGPSSESDHDDGSGSYHGDPSGSSVASPRMTRSRTMLENAEPG